MALSICTAHAAAALTTLGDVQDKWCADLEQYTGDVGRCDTDEQTGSSLPVFHTFYESGRS